MKNGIRTALLVLLSLVGCAPETPEVASVEAELKNGTLAPDDVAVVPIFLNGNFNCTGTLVDPRVVVTAAHCVSSREDELTILDSALSIRVIDFEVHPSYRTTAWPDVALLALEHPAAPSPLPISDVTASIEPGATMNVLGFGRNSPDEQPVRRRGLARVREASLETLVLDGDGSEPCLGDSGGPVLEVSAGAPRLLGVISFGNSACSGKFNAARVDSAL
jgi:secreted trypsin-like serine protease